MISYIGGKSRMAKWICEYIPDDIETYVEVFGGAFWVYIKGDIHEKPNLKEVVYNDKNVYMANLFECMRKPNEFYKLLTKHPSQNEKKFYMFQKLLENDPLINNFGKLGKEVRGLMYAYLATQVFSGSKILESKFIDLKGKYGSKYDALRNRLQKTEIQDKLKKITDVHSLDYTDIILKYDSPTTFFYVDPPYWKTEDYYSNHDFDSDDHYTLVEHLKRIKGNFALSYYDFPALRTWLPKTCLPFSFFLPKDQYRWEKKEFKKAAGATKGKKQNKGTELLIMNY